jgi:Xaa-Pro aminopeptidase
MSDRPAPASTRPSRPLRLAPAPAPEPPAPYRFSGNDYAGRQARAARAAAEAGLAGLLVAPGPDLVWLTGYRPTAITERLTLLVLPAAGPPTLVLPRLERPDAEAAASTAGLSIVDWPDGADPYQLAGTLLAVTGSYGISDYAWSVHLLGLQRTLRGSGYQPLSGCLPMLRAVKDSAELARLAAAGAAADAAYAEILRVPFSGRHEDEIAADLADLLRQFGHEQVDFTVVGSGPNGANPHHEAGDRVIRPGDAVVLDFGGLLDGYGSDTTRTVTVGPPSAEIRAVHGIVQAAQQAAFEAVAVGVPCEQIDRVARRVITDAGYGERFIHRTGHGIGTTTHEPPYLVEGERQPLELGMCFSIEPGIYLPGQFGVRLEDIVTVTPEGGRRLNNTSHELRVVY